MNHIYISSHDSFHVQIVLDAILASFTAQARMFDTAESIEEVSDLVPNI